MILKSYLFYILTSRSGSSKPLFLFCSCAREINKMFTHNFITRVFIKHFCHKWYRTHNPYFPTFSSMHPAARPFLYTILALTNCALRPYATAICSIRTWHYYLYDANTRFANICNSQATLLMFVGFRCWMLTMLKTTGSVDGASDLAQITCYSFFLFLN